MALTVMFLMQLIFAAHAEPTDDIDLPMKFTIVRSGNPTCEPSCPQWIWARGAIEASTPATFKQFLKTLGKKRLPVVISSPGGNVDAAMKLGRMIRERKLDVGIGTAYLTGCPADQKDCLTTQKKTGVYSGVIVDYDAYCNSACPLVLAGGIRRLAGPTTYVGVHQITTTYTRERILYREKYRLVKGKKRVIEKKVVSRKKVGTYTSTKLPKSTERVILAYLKEMGVAKSYFTAAQGTPAKDMRKLDRLEMFAMNLTTGDEAAFAFIRAGLCQASEPAANCVEVAVAGGTSRSPGKTPAVGPAIAGTEPETMQFVIVRSDKGDCEPYCPEWISGEGAIDDKTPARLEAVLKRLGSSMRPLVISSDGGDIDASIRLGKLARANRLVVVVGSTAIADCQWGLRDCLKDQDIGIRYRGRAKSYGGICTNDCALVLAGGAQRLAGYDTVVGWEHVAQMPKVVAAKTVAHLKEMGVHSRVLGESSTEPLGQRSQWRLFRVNLLTATLAVETVIERCKGVSAAADNCITAMASRQ